MSKAQSTRPTAVDEDVDDLDDVLEQFTPTRPKPAVDSKKASTSATPQLPATAPKTSSATSVKPPIGIDDLDIGDDFARELAEGMASLMREIAAESGTTPDKGNEKGAPQSEEDLKREEEFRKAWEAMLVEGLNGQMEADAHGGASEGKRKEGEAVKEDEFQASIRKAMEKLKESEANLHSESESGADPLEALLSQLGEGGGEPEAQLQGLLETMMTQLMSKEILYEPLKELSEKFPGYLAENASKMKAEDRQRYESQQKVVTQIITLYEDPTYSPDNSEKALTMSNLMNEGSTA
ncbi:hypothetical protein PHLCEN_2v10637 [Hermanssonia centrifuga]|uniref:Peroxin 19 n=1 Tax=Hermanssonia centrifuga TaxID=98765 RepID=A0A2R6NMC5_9APHY|nr:hypothetical protein PHLCEN_2v10637 [Hermanssonia centrifuga]